GHFVTLDYVGRVDGKPFRGGSGQGATFQLGSETFPPPFEERLHGLEAGQDREITVAIPEHEGWGDAAGREATFAVHLAAVKRRVVPELDDAFARDVRGFARLDEPRERVRG